MNIARLSVLLLWSTVGIGHPSGVGGQERSLEALLAAADADNPRIAAARQAALAAEARITQAGVLPDPMLGIALMNVPLRDPGLRNEEMTMAQVRAEAELPWPGKLGLAERAARLSAEAAVWEVESVRQEVLAEVQSAYFDLYFLDHALAVVERNSALLLDLSALMSARYAVGGTDQRSVLEVDLERARLRQENAVLLEQRTGTEAEINALLGRPTDTAVPRAEVPERMRAAALRGIPASRFTAAVLAGAAPPDDTTDPALPTVRELQRVAAERSPAIRAHLSRVSAQETAVSIAEAAWLPDFTVSVAYSGRAGLSDLFDVMVSAPLPIFSGRKQRQAVVEQDAMLGESEGQHHAMLSELDAEIASLHAELLRLRQELLILADRILPRARASFAAGSSAYRAGTGDLGSLLDAQATLYRHELEYHRLLADFARSAAALERAVGAEVVR